MLSNKLGHIFVLMALSVRCCYAPRTLVAAHVASVKGLLVEFGIAGYYDPGRLRHAGIQDTDLS